MPKFKVRDGFWLHGFASEPLPPGTVVDLNAEQAAAYAHQIEAVVEAEAKPTRATRTKAGDR